MAQLTDKQETFCREYLIDFNGTQAAIRAGYSKNTAGSIAGENLKKPEIQARLACLIEERNKRSEIDADYVLRQAVKLHERCMQEVSPKVDRKGMPIRDEDGNPLYVFDSMGAKGALELIGKHVGVQAFRDNINHSGDIGITWNEERTYEAKSETDTGA